MDYRLLLISSPSNDLSVYLSAADPGAGIGLVAVFTTGITN